MGPPVLLAAVRSPVTAVHGALAGLHPVELLASVLDAVARAAGVDAAAIGDVVAGCVEQVGGQSGNVARAAVLAAGWPETVGGVTVDRGPLSGVTALATAAALVRAGSSPLVVATAVDVASTVPPGAAAMGRHAFGRPWQGVPDDQPRPTPAAVAEALGVDRSTQDDWAQRSIERARVAVGSAGFAAEIVVPAGFADVGDELVAARPPSRAELDALPPMHSSTGSGTAGNTAPAADGAAAMLVADADWARARGLPVLAQLDVAVTAATGDDTITGARSAIDALDVDPHEVDDIELHEQCAAVATAIAHALGLSPERCNADGGAIAFGNPTATATLRSVVTLAHRLARAQHHLGLFVAGVPGGGAAVVLRR